MDLMILGAVLAMSLILCLVGSRAFLDVVLRFLINRDAMTRESLARHSSTDG